MVDLAAGTGEGSVDGVFFDVHVDEVTVHAGVFQTGGVQKFNGAVEPVEEMCLVAVPRFESDVDADTGCIFAERAHALDSPFPFLFVAGQGFSLTHWGRTDDDGRGSDGGGEVGYRLAVVQGLLPVGGAGVDQVAFLAEPDAADGADVNACVLGELVDFFDVVRCRFSYEFDGVVAVAGDAVDAFSVVFLVVDDGVVGLLEAGHVSP